MTNYNKPTRFEVIDETGRAYSRWGTKIRVDIQDEGKTMKVFIETNDAEWENEKVKRANMINL